MRLICTLLVVWAASIPAAALAQHAHLDAGSHPALAHRHGLEVGLGLMPGVSFAAATQAGGVSVESNVGGFMGSLTYLYGLDEQVLLTVGVGALAVDASVSSTVGNSSIESSTVSMLLFGVRYRFPALGEQVNVRPYASVGLGPCLGTASEVRAGPSALVGSRTEWVPGARVGFGLTAGPNSWLTAGIGGGYHLVADFDERIGAEKNYSNPDFLLTFGFRFGASGL